MRALWSLLAGSVQPRRTLIIALVTCVAVFASAERAERVLRLLLHYPPAADGALTRRRAERR